MDMAAKAIHMKQLKQILRLHRDGFSINEIVRHTGISWPTVKKYLLRVQNVLSEDLEKEILNDKDLSAAVYNNNTITIKGKRYTQLLEHFMYAETELKKTGVTRQLLWLEYKEQYADGYNYSQYCYHLSEFLKNKEVVMHLEHTAGEKIMVDFAGAKRSYVDTESGELIECHIFVAVLPHSGLIFCHAVHSQDTYDFLSCINEMLKFFGGTTLTILCDNLKTAVTRSDRYEPVFTDMCNQLSEHYGTTFSATRPFKPRDKAMVEGAVKIIYNHIYGPLRNEVFRSIREMNYAFYDQLKKLNEKPYNGSPYGRRQLFDQHEKALLKTLPAEPFVLKKTLQATVQRNYHVQLSEDHRYYSVPYTYAGKKVKVLYDNKTVEIYYEHDRIAIHTRSYMTRAYTTIHEHMPSNHQYAMNIKGWTKSDLLARAADIGTFTAQAVEHILNSSIYPEQNYKSCHGLLMLKNQFGHERIEAACLRALKGTRVNYTMIKNILHAGLDKQKMIDDDARLPDHDNIRGPENYQ
jgi:transposase